MAQYKVTGGDPLKLGMSSEEKKKRAAARKARDLKSFAKPAPLASSPTPKRGDELRKAMGLSAPSAIGKSTQPQAVKPSVVSPLSQTQLNAMRDKPGKTSTKASVNPNEIIKSRVGADRKYSIGGNSVTVHARAKSVNKKKDKGKGIPYDVNFDPSVSQDARDRFMRQPGAGRSTPFRQNFYSAEPNKFRVTGPKQSAAMPEFEGGWKTRLALKKQYMAGQQELANTQAAAATPLAKSVMERNQAETRYKEVESNLGEMAGKTMLYDIMNPTEEADTDVSSVDDILANFFLDIDN